ncbi:MAG: GAF domain-containing protein [Candidatus Kuenenia sp.]|nr:GAF domain-containing protein [Candidatus Kuenenia hertensis]
MHSFLIITKDDAMHNLLKKSFQKEFSLLFSKNTEDTFYLFLNQEIDIVFLDILIKTEETNRLFEFFRQTNADPTIIALIPPAQPMLVQEAMRIGAYEFLEKPLKNEVLQFAVKRALERQELKKEIGFIQSQIKHLSSNDKNNGIMEHHYSRQTDSRENYQFAYKDVLQKFSKALAYVHDLKKLVDLIVEALSEIFGVGKIVFLLVDKEDGICRPFRCIGIDETTSNNMCFNAYDGVMMWLSKNHQILKRDIFEKKIASDNLKRREMIRIQKEINLLQAQLCIPIFIKGNLISVVALGNKITGKEFFDEDIELLTMLSRYIGMALENAILYQEVNLGKIHNENVLENIPCGVIAIDCNCKINTFNKSAARMLHSPTRDIVGKDVKHIGSVFADIILRTLKEKKIYEMCEIEHPATHSTFAVSTSLLSDKNNVLGAIMVFSDLSEVKKLETKVKTLENQAFYHMLSRNMAHYIKNHLVAVKTFVDLFPEKHEEKEFEGHFFPVAQNEINKLDLMVKKLTILGENGNIMRKMVDIRFAIDQAINCHTDKLEKQRVKLIKQFSSDTVFINGDCEKLQEAFSNIILNALESMKDGGILTVKLNKMILDNENIKDIFHSVNSSGVMSKFYNIRMPIEESKNYVEVIIQDTGCGINKEESKEIFLPFFTTKTHNIGLGLSISQRIIEEYDGFIYFETEENYGSCFHVLLPNLIYNENLINS